MRVLEAHSVARRASFHLRPRFGRPRMNAERFARGPACPSRRQSRLPPSILTHVKPASSTIGQRTDRRLRSSVHGSSSGHCSKTWERFMSSSQANTRPHWSTSSIGDCADTPPVELAALHDHLGECKASRGRLFALQQAADSFNAFMMGRPVTIWVVSLISLIAVSRLL
jgi:hypothetical protein